MDIYQAGIRPILFSALKADPEWLHQRTLQALGWLERTSERPLTQWVQAQLQFSRNGANALGAKISQSSRLSGWI